MLHPFERAVQRMDVLLEPRVRGDVDETAVPADIDVGEIRTVVENQIAARLRLDAPILAARRFKADTVVVGIKSSVVRCLPDMECRGWISSANAQAAEDGLVARHGLESGEVVAALTQGHVRRKRGVRHGAGQVLRLE